MLFSCWGSRRIRHSVHDWFWDSLHLRHYCIQFYPRCILNIGRRSDLSGCIKVGEIVTLDWGLCDRTTSSKTSPSMETPASSVWSCGWVVWSHYSWLTQSPPTPHLLLQSRDKILSTIEKAVRAVCWFMTCYLRWGRPTSSRCTPWTRSTSATGRRRRRRPTAPPGSGWGRGRRGRWCSTRPEVTMEPETTLPRCCVQCLVSGGSASLTTAHPPDPAPAQPREHPTVLEDTSWSSCSEAALAQLTGSCSSSVWAGGEERMVSSTCHSWTPSWLR